MFYNNDRKSVLKTSRLYSSLDFAFAAPKKEKKATSFSRHTALSNLELLRAVNKNVFALGKTAELHRGLYDSAHCLQYYWPEYSGNAMNTCYKGLKSLLKGLNYEDNFVSLECPVMGNRGFITPLGIIYHDATYVNDNGSTTDLKAFRSSLSQRPISLHVNHQWFTRNKFYDEEMCKDGHYNSINTAISEMNGDDSDVVALRFLLEFVEKEGYDLCRLAADHIRKATHADLLYNHFAAVCLELGMKP